MRTATASVATAALGLAFALATGCNNLSNGSFDTSAPATYAAVAAKPKPKVEIISPARASFLAPGPVTVTGRTDPAFAGGPSVSAIEIEGARVAVAPDGTFTTQVTLVPGLNVIRGTVFDANGDSGFTTAGVLAGTWRPPSDLVPEAAGIRLNDAGMSGIEKLIEDGIGTLDTAQLGTTPVLDESWTVFRVRATVAAVRYGAAGVHLDPQADGFHVAIDVADPVIELGVEIDVNGVPLNPETVVILADRISVATRAIPQIGADERIEVAIAGTTVQFPNLRIQSSSPTIQQIQSVLYNFAGRVIETLVGSALDRLKPPPLEPMPMDVLGKRSILDVRGNRVRLDQSGMELLLKANCAPVDWTAAALAAPGSLATPGTAPALQTGFGVHLSLDDDALNRVGFGLWASGALVYDMDAEMKAAAAAGPPPASSASPVAAGGAIPLLTTLTALELKQILPELGSLVSDTAPVNIVASAHLPPVFRVAAPPDVLEIQAGEVWLDLQVDRGSGWETVLTVAAHLSVSANLTLGPAGLELSSSATPRFLVDVVDMPLVAIDERRIEIALALLLTPGVPFFINQAKFPIVELQGLTMVGASAFADGASGDYLSVLGNLSR